MGAPNDVALGRPPRTCLLAGLTLLALVFASSAPAQPPQGEAGEGAVLSAYLADIGAFRADPALSPADGFFPRSGQWLDRAPSLLVRAARSHDLRVSPATIQAAILLHLAAATRTDRAGAGAHLRLIVALTDATRSILPREFVGRITLARVWFHQRLTEPILACEALDNVLDLGEPSGDALLAQATLWESLANLARSELPRPPPLGSRAAGKIVVGDPHDEGRVNASRSWVEPRRIRQLAAGVLRKALKQSPDLDEARVRLAFIDILLGRLEDAAADVAPVVARDPAVMTPDRGGPIPYFAALAYGRALLGLGKPERALESFRRAEAGCPACQTARLAVSQALTALGHTADADAVTRRVLLDGHLTGSVADPWWEYPYGQSWRLPALIRELIEETKP